MGPKLLATVDIGVLLLVTTVELLMPTIDAAEQAAIRSVSIGWTVLALLMLAETTDVVLAFASVLAKDAAAAAAAVMAAVVVTLMPATDAGIPVEVAADEATAATDTPVTPPTTPATELGGAVVEVMGLAVFMKYFSNLALMCLP